MLLQVMEIGIVEPYQEKSGIGAFTSGLYPELRKEENVSLISLDFERQDFPILSQSYDIYFKTSKIIKEESSKFDVLFLPSHTMLAGLDLSQVESKVAVMVHDLERYPLQEGTYIQRLIRNKSIEKIKDTDYVFVPSESTRLDLIKYAEVDPNKTHNIGEGVEKFDEIEEIETPGKYFLYVGDMQQRKNVDNLVKAYSDLDDKSTKLVFAGRVYSDQDKQRIKGLVKKLDISEHVQFFGEVSKGQLRYLYENTEGYIHPAYFEGFGRTPLEAAAHGAPVAVVKGTAPAEYIGQSVEIDPSSKGIKEGLNKIAGTKAEVDISWEDVKKSLLESLGDLD